MRRIIVLSGKDRLAMVEAMCSETWLKPSGVVGVAIDSLSSGDLAVRFGDVMAGKILAKYRALGGSVVGTAVGRVERVRRGGRRALRKA